MKRLTLLVVLASLGAAGSLTACVEPLPLEAARAPLPPAPPPPPPPPRIEEPTPQGFRANDFAWSTAPGPNRISGHLSYGRGTYSCAGASVVLTPETPWVRQRMLTLY